MGVDAEAYREFCSLPSVKLNNFYEAPRIPATHGLTEDDDK